MNSRQKYFGGASPAASNKQAQDFAKFKLRYDKFCHTSIFFAPNLLLSYLLILPADWIVIVGVWVRLVVEGEVPPL